jgi:hypothetical protein
MEMQTKPKRTSNIGAAQLAYHQTPFVTHNNTLFGEWVTPWLYVVFSYGQHWPLFVFEKIGGTWMVNEDKFSRTTSKHRGQAHPREGTHWVEAQPRSCSWLKELIYDHVRAHQREAA